VSEIGFYVNHLVGLFEQRYRAFSFGASNPAELKLQPSNVRNGLALFYHRLEFPLF
jgi:hypothetical protein